MNWLLGILSLASLVCVLGRSRVARLAVVVLWLVFNYLAVHRISHVGRNLYSGPLARGVDESGDSERFKALKQAEAFVRPYAIQVLVSGLCLALLANAPVRQRGRCIPSRGGQQDS